MKYKPKVCKSYQSACRAWQKRLKLFEEAIRDDAWIGSMPEEDRVLIAKRYRRIRRHLGSSVLALLQYCYSYTPSKPWHRDKINEEANKT